MTSPLPPYWILTAFLLLLPAVSTSQQPAAKPPVSLVVTLMIYSMEKSAGDAVQAGQESGKDAANEKLQALISAKQANLTTLLAVSTRSGQRSVSNSPHASVAVDPVLGPDGKLVSLSGSLTVGTQKTPIPLLNLSMGDTVIAARLGDPAAARVELAFLRVQSQ